MAEISILDQQIEALTHGLARIASGDIPAEELGDFAMLVLKNTHAIRRNGEPLHGIETSDYDHGERMGQPPGVLYTLTITDEGDANEWRSDRVRTPDQVAWLHEIVIAAAANLAGTAAGPSGVN